jgi:hypothetical protein
MRAYIIIALLNAFFGFLILRKEGATFGYLPRGWKAFVHGLDVDFVQILIGAGSLFTAIFMLIAELETWPLSIITVTFLVRRERSGGR